MGASARREGPSRAKGSEGSGPRSGGRDWAPLDRTLPALGEDPWLPPGLP